MQIQGRIGSKVQQDHFTVNATGRDIRTIRVRQIVDGNGQGGHVAGISHGGNTQIEYLDIPGWTGYTALEAGTIY
ncbi:MAG: hypothetical protein O2860_10225 [Chloroflexi bacterium]|nr:hypothetical protein [Chloroflexota bacterium]